MEVIGQSSDMVPAGLATVAPVKVKSEPSEAVPPVLFRTSWLAKTAGAAEIPRIARASTIAIRRAGNLSLTTG